ncbi:MAG: DUF1697 domain-containing protein [Mycobacteriales bacterium]
MRWVLLLRAVNVGGNNTLPMKDLKALLEDLGHEDVRTYLNSGNATFTSSRGSAAELATEVEQALRERLGLGVRVCVRTDDEIRKALDELPELAGYVTVSVLFDRPSAAALQALLATPWPTETVLGNDQVLYIGYEDGMRKTKLTNGVLEKALGVSCTARTPATLRKLLG